MGVIAQSLQHSLRDSVAAPCLSLFRSDHELTIALMLCDIGGGRGGGQLLTARCAERQSVGSVPLRFQDRQQLDPLESEERGDHQTSCRPLTLASTTMRQVSS